MIHKNLNKQKLFFILFTFIIASLFANLSHCMQDETCIMCFDNFEEEPPIITECNHLFHYNCMSRWLHQHNNCPTCRERLPGTKFFCIKAENEIFVLNRAGERINKNGICANPQKIIQSLYLLEKDTLGVVYSDKQIDLFAIKNQKKINTNPIEANQEQAIRIIRIPHSNLFILDILIIIYANNQIELFNIFSGEKTNAHPIEADREKIIDIVSFGSGNLYVRYSDNCIDIFDKKNGQKRSSIQAHPNKRIKKISTIDEQKKLYVIYTDGQVDLFEMHTGNKINTQIIKILKNNWQEILYVQYPEQKVNLFDMDTGKKIKIKSVNILREIFYITYDNKIDIFNAHTNKKILTIYNKKSPSIKILNKEMFFIRSLHNQINLFNTKNGKQFNQKVIHAHPDKAIIELFIHRKTILSIKYPDNQFDLFDVKTGEKICAIHAMQNKEIKRIKAQGNRLCIIYHDNQVDFFSTKSGRKINENSMQAAQDKEIVSTGILNHTIVSMRYVDDQIDLFYLHSGEKICSIQANEEIVKEYVLENSFFCIEYQDDPLALFDMHTGKKIETKESYILDGQDYTLLYVQHLNSKTGLFNLNNGKIVQVQSVGMLGSNNICAIYSDNFINLFNISYGARKVSIQAQKRKKINHIDLLKKKIISVEYADNQIDLFNKYNGTKINTHVIQANSYKKIAKITILDEATLGIQYQDNQIDQFNIRSGNKITQRSIKNNRRKEIIKTGVINKRYSYSIYSDNQLDLFDNMSDNKKICTIHANKHKKIKKIAHTRQPKQLGIILLFYDDQQIDVFNTYSGTKITSVQAKPNLEVEKIHVINNKIICITYFHNKIDLFSMHNGKKIDTRTIHKIKYQGQNAFCIQRRSGSIDLFNVKSSNRIKVKEIGYIHQQRNKILYIQSNNNKIDLFNVSDSFFDYYISKKTTLQANPNKKVIKIKTNNIAASITYSDASIDVFNINNGNKIITIQETENKKISKIYPIGGRHVGRTLICISYSNNQIDLFNLENNTRISTIEANPNKLTVEATLLSHAIVCVVYVGKQIDLFDSNTGQKITPNTIQTAATKEIVSTKIIDKKIISITYGDNQVELFSIFTGQKLNTNPDNRIVATKIFDKILYVRYSNNFIDLFDVNNYKKINTHTIQHDPDERIKTEDILEHNILCIEYYNKKINLFDIRTGKKINKNAIYYNPYKQVEYTHIQEQAILCIGYRNNEHDLFDIHSGKMLNPNTIYALVNKEIIRIGTLEKKVFYVIYKDNQIDFFIIVKSQKIGSLQIATNKTIGNISLKNSILLHVPYADGTHDIFNIHNGKKIVRHIIFNETIACLEYDNNTQIELYNIKTCQTISFIQSNPDKKIAQISLTEKNAVCLTYNDKKTDLFDMPSGQKIKQKLDTSSKDSPYKAKKRKLDKISNSRHGQEVKTKEPKRKKRKIT